MKGSPEHSDTALNAIEGLVPTRKEVKEPVRQVIQYTHSDLAAQSAQLLGEHDHVV